MTAAYLAAASYAEAADAARARLTRDCEHWRILAAHYRRVLDADWQGLRARLCAADRIIEQQQATMDALREELQQQRDEIARMCRAFV